MGSIAPRFGTLFGLGGVLCLAGLVFSTDVSAEPSGASAPGGRLQEIERALETGQKERDASRRRAAELATEVQALRKQLVSAAAKTQKHEAAVASLEERLAELGRAELAKTEQLRDRREQFVRVLLALQRMARHPPEAVIAQPLDAASIVRSAILLRTAVPQIEGHTVQLRDELAALTRLRQETAKKRAELASATAGLEQERKILDGLIRKKTSLKSQADRKSQETARRLDRLAREAKDLRDLMLRIEAERKARLEAERKAQQERDRVAREKAKRIEKEEAERKKEKENASDRQVTIQAPPAKPAPSDKNVGVGSGAEIISITRAKGRLPYPAVGRVIGRYGQATGSGLTRKGISIETRDGAHVISPYDGLVVFAGPFRGYGEILILEHGEGYHTLLAGMTRIDTVLGQWLAAGEPVGLMEATDRRNPVLYVELRRNGQPINPLPWLASRKDKESG
ncbi:MAG: peptidoglycan DD-metalloendopeptidase family protein [Rhodospirillales bacterium]|nr:peptidoglycan DD-metalloendopeptidase family protein [Rhodospirillales bacterium]